MHDTGFIGTVLNLTGFGVFHRFGHVRRYRAHFRVRHQTARTQNGTQLANNTHGIRRSNHHIEVQITGLDLFSQIFKTHNIGTGFFSRFGIGALSKYRHTGGFAGAFGQHYSATNHLV